VTLLIFDCDGVLVDSEIIALDALAKLLTGLGLPMTVVECRQRFMGKSVKDVLAEIERLLGRPLPADWGQDANAALLARLATELQAVEGVAAVLNQLAYPRCVASSSPPERIHLSLAASGLAAYFGDHVFSAADVENGKPAPDLFLFAARQCGAAPSQSIVIEDSPTGIQAAQRAGMKSIGFAGASHADDELAAALAAAGADTVIGRMAGLPQVIESLRATHIPQGRAS
jgi:HAD superfamily hydrolase (TIGR01509 family)